MKKKLLLLAGICFLLTGCGAKMPAATESVGFATEEDGVLETETIEGTENTEEEPDPEGTIRTTKEDLRKLPPEIQSIYNGNGTFYDVEEKKEFTKESFRAKDTENGLTTAVYWTDFLVADIDQDGEFELGVYMVEKDDGVFMGNEVRIFDLSKGMVYAHPYVFRAVTHVGNDGVIEGSSGAADNVWYEIHYDGEKETQIVVVATATEYVEGEGPGIHYYIGEKEVSEDEFLDYDFGVGYEILWSEEDLDDIIG